MKIIEINNDVAEWIRSKTENRLVDIGSILKMLMLKEKGTENQYVLTGYGPVHLDTWKDFGPSGGIGGYNGLISVDTKTYEWLLSLRKTGDETLSSVLRWIREYDTHNSK